MTEFIKTIYQKWVIGAPAIVLLLLMAVAGFFLLQADKFNLDASSDSLLLENDQSLNIFRETNERYGTQEFLFVTFKPDNGDLFSEQSLQTISELKTDLSALEQTDSVLSLVDVPLLKVVGGTLAEVAKNYQTLADPEVDRQQAKQELLASPIFRQLIISEDATTTALQLNLKQHSDYQTLQKQRNRLLIKKFSTGLDEADKQQLLEITEQYKRSKEQVDQANHLYIQQIREVLDRYQGQGQLHLGGISMIADDMITFIQNDLIVFGSGILVFLVILLSVIFRQIRWVVLPLMSCVFAGLVMIGILGYMGWSVTVISSNFISLMLILTMSMNVHLIVRYRQLRAENQTASQSELVMQTTEKMVWPCLYTALTTMIGFSSLVFSGIKPVIDFGWMMTMGLTVTFLTSFLLFPAILLFLPLSDRDIQRSDTVMFTSTLARVTEKRGNWILLVSVFLAVLCVVGIKQLRVENSFINYFSEDTEIYQGLKLIDEKLGGTTPLDIIIKLPGSEPDIIDSTDQVANDEESFEEFDDFFDEFEDDPGDTFFTTTNLETISSVHNYMESLPAVGKVLSLSSLLWVAEDLNEGKPFDAFELAVINKLMPQELKSSLFDPYVSIDEFEARVNVRIKDSLPDLRRKALLDKIEHDLQHEIGLQPQEYQLSGLLVLYNNMLQSLFDSQIKTLGVVMLGIALMLLLLFRSVNLAVIGIIPNILAACVILGLMGLLDIPLDMMTITIAAITIGIAVDNSIHYIYRFREEYPKTGDYLKTLHVCHANIGRAVFYTAITIIFGFSILVMSNFIPTIYFGLLTAFAMFIALLAALTLLPKLILMWKPF